MKTILVPLDGSELSESAIEPALSLVESEGQVHLLRVLETTQLKGWLPIDLVEAHQREKHLVSQYLEKLSQRFNQAQTLSHEGPDPADGIAAAANKLDADLVVMTSHGRNGVVDHVIGSVAERVIRRIDRPALMLKGELSSPFRRQKFLVPLDGSKLAERAVQYVQGFAEPGAEILLVGVSTLMDYVTPMERDIETVIEPDLDRIRRYLAEWTRTLFNLGFEAEAFAVHGKSTREIVKLAHQQQVDAVVIGSHGHSGLKRLVLGSTAEGVLRNSNLPVLVVR